MSAHETTSKVRCDSKISKNFRGTSIPGMLFRSCGFAPFDSDFDFDFDIVGRDGHSSELHSGKPVVLFEADR